MSKHDLGRLLARATRNNSPGLGGQLGEISKSKAYLEVRATRSVEAKDVDGGFAFVEDRRVEVYLDPVGPGGRHAAWTSGYGDPMAGSEASYLTLLARAEGDDLKGFALRAELLPFSMNWELSADYKSPSSDSKAQKAMVLEEAIASPRGASQFLDTHSVELFESKPSSTARKYKFARIQIGRQRFPDVFSGKKAFGGATPRASAAVLREALWGISPTPIAECVDRLLENSEYLKTLRRLADGGKLGFAFRTPYLSELTEDTRTAIATCLLAACYKAFAGPEDFETGPVDGGWRHQPVSRLAGWYFMRILREYNRRSLNKRKSEASSGQQDAIASRPSTRETLSAAEFEALSQLAHDQVFEAIESEQPLDSKAIVASLDPSEPMAAAMGLQIVSAMMRLPSGAPYLARLIGHGLKAALATLRDAVDSDNSEMARRLLDSLPSVGDGDGE